MNDDNMRLSQVSWTEGQSVGERLALLAGEAFTEFLPRQRWFADKDAELGAVRLIDAVAFDAGADIYGAIVELERSQRLYFIPVAVTADADVVPRDAIARVRQAGGEVLVADAFVMDEAARVLLADIRAGRRRAAEHGGAFVAHAAATLAEIELAEMPAVRRLAVEQSNTSIVIGGSVMLKAYRRIHHGPQAELEIARFLDAVGYRNTPALLGFVEYESPHAEPAALCIAQRFVANTGDGWATTLAHLAAYFGRTGTNGDSTGDAEDAAFTATIRTLGRRTAELHRAFATPTGDPAFEPESVGDDDIAVWVEQAQATANAALRTLERELVRIPPTERAAAQALLARRDEVMERLTIPPLDAAMLTKTRFHGDYHLGQVLVVGADFMIVDFEGEPGRDPSARRHKSSPLRDVAGMLRSLNYATVSGLRGAAGSDGETMPEQLRRARAWEQRNVAAFLDGYRAAVTGTSSYPTDPQLAARLLDLFALEKAFYELSYELANRPAWLRIPLDGIRAILDAATYAAPAS